MTPSVQTLGIIAGNRSLPLLLARQARQMGVARLVAVAFEGETDPALAPLRVTGVLRADDTESLLRLLAGQFGIAASPQSGGFALRQP